MSYSKELSELLRDSAEKLRAARLPAEVPNALEQLARQIEEPCVLAVVGRAKAGKSTFVNALLGDDLAKVGVTETTATINFFRYGTPQDESKPIRCYWRGGRYENVSRQFLDSLQGNTIDVLRRAAGIAYLEYWLPNPALRDITLVDTPGMDAAVDEHQNRTAEFLNLQRQLRERHNQETEYWTNQADAIVYLIGQVPRATDQALLDEFAQVTGRRSRALNAIGVMAKIDLQPEILSRCQELAAKAGEKLKDQLNTVVPVSAGIQRALDHLRREDNKWLKRLMTELRKIPPRRLEKLLDSDELYEMDFDDCPVRADTRRELRGDMPWTVFTTIARLAADRTLGEQDIITRLDTLSGFGPLREVLERHIFKRSRTLRYYRILNEVRRILNDIRYQHYPKFLEQDHEKAAMRDRFLAFIRQAKGDPTTAKELEYFVERQIQPQLANRLMAVYQDLKYKSDTLYHDLEEHNADFEALSLIERHHELFMPLEQSELRPLLGLYGIDSDRRLPANVSIEYIAERQQHWAEVKILERNPVRRHVADRAEARYSLILNEMLKDSVPSN